MDRYIDKRETINRQIDNMNDTSMQRWMNMHTCIYIYICMCIYIYTWRCTYLRICHMPRVSTHTLPCSSAAAPALVLGRLKLWDTIEEGGGWPEESGTSLETTTLYLQDRDLHTYRYILLHMHTYL